MWIEDELSSSAVWNTNPVGKHFTLVDGRGRTHFG